MATAKKSRASQKIEEKPAEVAVGTEASAELKIVVKKPRAAKSVAKKVVTKKVSAEPVSTKRTGGFLARAVHGTLFVTGRLISAGKNLKDINKVVEWKNISASAKTMLDSTKQGAEKIGGSIKNAVSVEKLSAETKKAWSSTREGALKVGETLKNAVPVEKISEGTKKAWSSTKEGAIKVGGSLKNSVPVEKISAGTKKVLASTRQEVRKISRSTAEGLTEIGKSFQAGYRSFETKKVAHPAPDLPKSAPKPLAARKASGLRKKVVVVESKPEASHDAVPVPVVDVDLEKEVDQIVSEIAKV